MQGWPAEVSEAEGKARREAQLRAQYEFCATVARAADDEESAGAHSGPIFRVATGNSRGHLQIASEAKSATGNGLSPAALHRFREAIFIAADNLGDGAVAPVDFPVSSLRLIEVNNCELVALRAAMLFEQSQPESEMDPGAPDVAWNESWKGALDDAVEELTSLKKPVTPKDVLDLMQLARCPADENIPKL